jgi:hypothetical protein
MMIRDTGTYVEFWIKAGSSTFAYDMPWRYTINGSTSSWLEFRFESGGAYQRVGRWNITTDQTVTFYLGDTGTSGLGGPTTFSHAIDRTSAPPTPPPWVIEVIEDTQVRGDTDGYGTGGLTIDAIQVRYDNNSDASSPLYYNVNGTGFGWVTGLARGTTYYFWVRTHNAKGWSPWSSRTSAKTHNFPPPPTLVTLTNITQSSLHSRFDSLGDGGSPVLEWQTAYGTDPVTPTTFLSGYSLDITGLSPGMTYYFWARGRNKYGWGAYTARSQATLIAGAWVKVGTTWKRAVPYVRVSGVWKVARPWARIAGLWKETN